MGLPHFCAGIFREKGPHPGSASLVESYCYSYIRFLSTVIIAAGLL